MNLVIAVPTIPGKTACLPPIFIPATLPCLLATVPSATCTGLRLTRWYAWAQSPAAHMFGASVFCSSFTRILPLGPRGISASFASWLFGATPSPKMTRSAGIVRLLVITPIASFASPGLPFFCAKPCTSSLRYKTMPLSTGITEQFRHVRVEGRHQLCAALDNSNFQTF